MTSNVPERVQLEGDDLVSMRKHLRAAEDSLREIAKNISEKLRHGSQTDEAL